MNEIAYVDGAFVPMAEAKVSVEDRGYQFGDGVYEVVKFHGRTPVRLNEHLERLEQSCRCMRIDGGPSNEEWRGIIAKLLQLNTLPDDGSDASILYQQVTRGVSPRNHLFPKNVRPVSVAYFRKAPTYSPEQRQNGVQLHLHPDERWTKCHIKSICLLPAVMAKQAAYEVGAFEALLVRDGKVTECSASNAFCVRAGIIYTHPRNEMILGGVTRGMVIEAAQESGVELREEAVTPQEFADADEAFITSTTMNVMPATKLDAKNIGDGRVGEITRRVSDALEEIIARETRTRKSGLPV